MRNGTRNRLWSDINNVGCRFDTGIGDLEQVAAGHYELFLLGHHEAHGLFVVINDCVVGDPNVELDLCGLRRLQMREQTVGCLEPHHLRLGVHHQVGLHINCLLK